MAHRVTLKPSGHSYEVPEGKSVQVTRVEGLKLYVEPVEVASPAVK